MKKLLALLLAAVMVLSVAAVASADEMKVAMITDYGDITDQSFNQTTYEACKAFCEANGVEFTYKKPTGDSTAERVAMIEAAIDEGYNTIVMPGYAFGEAIKETAPEYEDVTFIGLDVGAGDLGDDFVLPENLYCAVYQEELCGYMAGYAAVRLGYKHLGFVGGMAVPAVVRYGYGFVQGANAAAEDKSAVTVEYVYGNQFFGDADITAYMDNWYQTKGVEVVFACGGGIFTSACEAALKVENGKVIGVDVDQSGVITSLYGDPTLTVTSAMKGLAATVNTLLAEVKDGTFEGGKIDNLGLVSADDPSLNYVGIPETTQFTDAFTMDDYKAMVADMYNGVIIVSNDTTVEPTVEIAVDYQGNIK